VPLTRGIGWLAPVYDRCTAPFERRSLGRWRRAAWAEVPAGGTGLEVGAGTGPNLSHHPALARTVATDLSPAMLRRAAARPERSAPLLACDAMALPFRDASFDWAVATLVFCEVPDPVAGLREIGRVLRPGGVLVLLEHVRPSGVAGLAADLLTRITAPLWGEHFDRDAEAAARRAGFALLRRRRLWGDAVVLLVLAPAPEEGPMPLVEGANAG
jgi:ubiquinone/menaquinone biosynthesis C-methylase UbiE